MKTFLLFLLLIGCCNSHRHHLHRGDYALRDSLEQDPAYTTWQFDRKNKKDAPKKKSEREESEEEKRRQGPTAKYNQSGSYEVRLHYNESLEFYRRSRQMQPLVDDYVKCINESARLYERSGRITSRAMMKLVGQDVVLKCRDCHYPGKQSTVTGAKVSEVQWRMIPYNEPHDINIVFDTEKFVFDNKTFDLTVSDLIVYDAARYRCVINKEVARVYDLQVVESDKSKKVFENEIDGLLPTPPDELTEHNLRFFTRWEDWGSCNECGVKSSRRRIGICMVEKINFSHPIKPADYPAFNMYGWGLPCRSPLVPSNFTAEYADYLARPSEIQLGHCEHPCPTPPPMVFITDSKGKIIDQYEGSEAGVYSLDSGPPKLPAMVQRVTAYEAEGDRIRMICPKYHADTHFQSGAKKSVRWQNCSTTVKGVLCRPIDPFHIEKKSEGRIVINVVNSLLIKKITFFDVGIYSCYYDGRLVATTKLFVNPRRNRNLKKNIMILGIIIVVAFFLVAIIYLIRNT